MFTQGILLNLSARFLDLKVKNNFFSLVRINTITVGKLSHYKLPIVNLPGFLGFPCGSAGKESARNVGDLGLIPGLGRSPGKGKSYPLQYSGLENSVDCIVHGVAKSQTLEQFSLPL